MSDISLGDRMKSYEGVSQSHLLPGLPIVARIDGRAFHSFTRFMKRPYDKDMSDSMVQTTVNLVKETGAILGYTQSDEISLLFYYANQKSQTFFNGRRDKMVSVLASMATLFFSEQQETKRLNVNERAFFDCRVFNLPTKIETFNYFLWRERDATKNSISMAAQSEYSHQALMKKNSSEKQEMLFQKGINWNNYPDFFKRGTYVKKLKIERKFTYEEIYRLPLQHEARQNPNLMYTRTHVDTVSVPPIGQIEDKIGFIFGELDEKDSRL